VKLSTHKTLGEAKKAASSARKIYNSVIVSSQPTGYVVHVGKRK